MRIKLLAILLSFIVFIPLQAQAACDVNVKRVSDGDTFFSDSVTVVSLSLIVVEEAGFRLARVYTTERKEPTRKPKLMDFMAEATEPLSPARTR